MLNVKRSDDAASNLAGTNQLEILTFRLEAGTDRKSAEIFGINVFKIRELVDAPKLTQPPGASKYVAGYANIRGSVIPVIDLKKYCGIDTECSPKILAITEFNRSTQAFLVHDVEQILRLNWSDIKPPPDVLSAEHANVLTAMTVLPDERILLIVDVEKVLADVMGSPVSQLGKKTVISELDDRLVFFADDSNVARLQIAKILDHVDVPYEFAADGQLALTALSLLADTAEKDGVELSTRIQAIITDVEMPIMDGYVLTRNIKADKRFDGIPVMMHSSLSADENIRLGMEVGADGYMPKLRPTEFIEKLLNLIKESAARAE